MHNILKLDVYFRLLQIPPVDIHRNSAGNSPEIHRNEIPESFKFASIINRSMCTNERSGQHSRLS